MPRKLPLPIGTSNYKKICEKYYYVDKTLLIKEILDDGIEISLFTRPRRFGKTLNMDMLRTFFEKTEADTSIYFRDKNIWQQGEEYTKHQGNYPVIYLSLKDIKAADWQTAFNLLKISIQTEFARHKELESSNKITKNDSAFYKKILTDEANEAEYMLSLQPLSRMLHEHYGKAPIILIDEYDTPIQEGYFKNFYHQAVNFTRNFFSAAFKDNPHLSFGILTGILRIAKESIFSGLNNVHVYSVLDKHHSNYFGFTADEVQAMAQYYNLADKLQEIKEWYDGYNFGNTEIFNPWSVINYFYNAGEARPYWVQTSENSTIHALLKELNNETCISLSKLLSGLTVKAVVETNIIYPKLKDQQANIFGFLLMTGYLKAIETTSTNKGQLLCTLSLPNKEIASVYYNEILSQLSAGVKETTTYNLNNALLTKDGKALQKFLSQFLIETISYYDTLKENYYHGLLLGMTVIFSENYYTSSNRESGEGRYDIMLLPKTHTLPGIIIEVKAAKKASAAELKKLSALALLQIEQKKYDTELVKQKVFPIYKYGIAFCGKHLEITTN